LLIVLNFISLKAPPKGPNQYYDPNNFDEFYCQEYGGYTLGEGLRGKGGRGGRGGGMGGGGGGGFGGRGGGGGMGGRGG
jgi:heterogeneous nuclear ribonucleoprotein K